MLDLRTLSEHLFDLLTVATAQAYLKCLKNQLSALIPVLIEYRLHSLVIHNAGLTFPVVDLTSEMIQSVILLVLII